MPVPETLAGRYQLRGLLGHGGMGDVYDGWDARLGRPIAVKVLRPDLAASADIRLRFESEARTAATVNHPNVVAVYDTGEDADIPFIVMERLPGRTLADEIAEGPLPPGRVRAVMADVLAALAAAHAAGVLHRDIKPGNVLFTTAGTVKVTDFGIAKTAESNQTATGEVLGTVAYLSPDRINGKPAVVTDDLYAVGIVGYEAIAGHRPFGGDNILSVARAILNQEAPRLGTLQTTADPGLIEVVERAMSPDPRARFPDADVMRRALIDPATLPPVAMPTAAPAAPVATRAFTSPVAVTVGPQPSPRKRRRPLLILAIIAAMIVAVAAGVLGVALNSDDTDAPVTTPSDTRASTSSPITPAEQTSPTTTTEAAPPPVAPLPTATSGNGNSNKDKEKEKKPDKGNGNNGDN
ncbi:UNVERIFIED_CONTAM: serine/threonine protein kinase [Williamsia faeni]